MRRHHPYAGYDASSQRGGAASGGYGRGVGGRSGSVTGPPPGARLDSGGPGPNRDYPAWQPPPHTNNQSSHVAGHGGYRPPPQPYQQTGYGASGGLSPNSGPPGQPPPPSRGMPGAPPPLMGGLPPSMPPGYGNGVQGVAPHAPPPLSASSATSYGGSSGSGSYQASSARPPPLGHPSAVSYGSDASSGWNQRPPSAPIAADTPGGRMYSAAQFIPNASAAQQARGQDPERPGRNLFIRSIDYDTDPDYLRTRFAEYGELKACYAPSHKRGILFVTYYDSRQATAAMNGLQGLQLNGRPISIHYCLPKEAERVAACDRDKNQGTLLLLLQNPQQSIQDAAVAATFGEFGDIKRLLRIHKLPDGRPPDAFLQANARYLEFFDSRAAQLAYDRMQNQLWQGGQWDLSFVWDWHLPQDDAPSLPPPSQGPLAPAGYNNQYGQSAPSQANRSAGSGVSPGGPQSHGPPASGGLSANQVETPMRRWGAGGNAGSSNDAGPAQAPHPGPGSYAAPSASGGQGGWAARPPAPNNQSYAATGNASPYGTAPPSGQSNDPGRLDQAQKVQQLLASLKGAGNSTPPQHSHSPQPGAGQAQQAPSATAAKPAASPAPTPGLPAGLAALLKQAGGGLQQNPPAQPAQPAQGQTNSAQSMQQLLAMLKPAGGQR